ncbi:MAG: hypothetical protein J2P17_26010 [Mycobacterium sp.]|nr:hypothetical protein [Mycobacterium sp.]
MRADFTADPAAIAVVERIQASGAPLSVELVRTVLDELAAHPSDCRCGRCAGARRVRPDRVLATARAWCRR